jgi:hypothetical protein
MLYGVDRLRALLGSRIGTTVTKPSDGGIDLLPGIDQSSVFQELVMPASPITTVESPEQEDAKGRQKGGSAANNLAQQTREISELSLKIRALERERHQPREEPQKSEAKPPASSLPGDPIGATGILRLGQQCDAENLPHLPAVVREVAAHQDAWIVGTEAGRVADRSTASSDGSDEVRSGPSADAPESAPRVRALGRRSRTNFFLGSDDDEH